MKYAEIDQERKRVRYGNAGCCLIEEIYTAVTTVRDSQYGDGADPRYPDDPFDQIPFYNLFFSYREQGLLAATRRAYPTAKRSPDHKRAYEQDAEHDEAAVDNAFEGGFDYEVRG